jgi:Putative DNA-binding domain
MPDPDHLDDEAAITLVRQLLSRQGEDRNLDYKAAMAFATNEVKGKLLKCIMAFANTRDGGHILVGVEQKGVRFEPTGLTTQQARSFDLTDIGNFARRHCSTLPRLTTREVTIDDLTVLLVRVAEFSDEPIVCTNDLHDSNQKSILRKGNIYVRTEDARCVAIDSSETMRSFLALAVQKHSEGLLEQIRGLVGAAPINAALTMPSELYAVEISSAEDMFVREELSAPEAYWYCSLMPASYVRERVPTIARLREIRVQAEVALRGWNFPHTDREHSQTFEDGVESVTHWSRHNEASRFYRSGLFTWRHLLREDASHEYEGTISFVSSIYSLLEVFVFASRYAPLITDTGDFIVSVGMANIGGYDLVNDTNGFRDTRSTAASMFAREYRASVEELRASYRDFATDAAQRLFELFSFDVPASAVEHWQSRLLVQRF